MNYITAQEQVNNNNCEFTETNKKKTLNEIYEELKQDADIEDCEQSLWDMAQKIYDKQKTTEILDIYNKKYDYDDMKIAICIKDFYNYFEEKLKEYYEEFLDFEDLITLAVEIKNNWQIDYDNGALTQNEIGYIQEYAFRYLKEKYNIED